MSYALFEGAPADPIKYGLIEFRCYVQFKLHTFIFVTIGEKACDT